jgi:ribosomal protein S18 acetylase RimI-like enzyme
MTGLARLLDELAANATPATTVQFVDGWVLRAAPGYPFRRCNSVLPFAPAAATAVASVEAFYRARGTPARFQVGPWASPPDLDVQLAGRGYEVEAPVDILVSEVPALRSRRAHRDVEVVLRIAVDDAWVQAYGALHGDDTTPGERVAAYGRLLRHVGPQVLVATVDVDGAPAGVGFGVVERGWLGIFGMGTRPELRRRGIATAILDALAGASTEYGAERCYLQVEADNDGAHALYRGLGFTAGHRYHYRTSWDVSPA